VDPAAKLAQHTVFLLLVLAIGAPLWVRSWEARATGHNEPDDRALSTTPPR
jgi:hypothetical protein